MTEVKNGVVAVENPVEASEVKPPEPQVKTIADDSYVPLYYTKVLQSTSSLSSSYLRKNAVVGLIQGYVFKLAYQSIKDRIYPEGKRTGRAGQRGLNKKVNDAYEKYVHGQIGMKVQSAKNRTRLFEGVLDQPYTKTIAREIEDYIGSEGVVDDGYVEKVGEQLKKVLGEDATSSLTTLYIEFGLRGDDADIQDDDETPDELEDEDKTEVQPKASKSKPQPLKFGRDDAAKVVISELHKLSELNPDDAEVKTAITLLKKLFKLEQEDTAA